MPESSADPAPDIVALARPLLEDLKKPEFFQSRCMLAPILATNKRIVAMSRDDTFHAGDRILAVNGEPLSATSDRALHDILIGYAPDATVTVRLLRAGSEADVAAPCSDNQSYYALLRAAATAAVQDDAATCADRMGEVGKLHALGAIWLNVALNCNAKAGHVAGAAMLAEYFNVYHEELLENEFSPDALQKARPSLQDAAQKLLTAGSRPLAEKLQQEYASAVAQFSPLRTGVLALELHAPTITSPSTGIIQQSPGVTITQNGNVTEMSVDGQLAAKHPVSCVPLSQIDSTRTPPDLYLGVAACIQQDDYRAAAMLFALAGVESRFDAERVLDKSAGQAGQVLIMNTFNGLPDEKHERFVKEVTEIAADSAALAEICGSIRKIGYPNYYPQYMVLHGIHAFTAKAGDPTLVPTFDATATWNSLLTTYLNCPAAPAAPLAVAKQATPTKNDAGSNNPNKMKPGLYQVQTNAGGLVPAEGNVAHKVATLRVAGALYVTFSADSAKVVTAGMQDTLGVWTWQHGDPTNHSLTMPAASGLSRANIAISISRDGRYIAATHASDIPDKTKPISQTNSSCRTIQIWDANTERPLIDLDGLPAWCNAGGIAFSNNGALLFVIEGGPQLCPDKTDHVVVFSTADWKRLWNICLEESEPGQLAVSPDDKLIAIGGYHEVKVDQSARPNAPMFESHEVVAIVDIQTHRTVRVIDGALPDQFDIGALAWSPDGRRLAVGGGNRRGDSRTDALKIYDPSSGTLVLAENSEYSDVRGIAYTSDGKYFIEGVVNKEVRIWDGSHEHLLQTFTTGWGSPFENVLTALAVSRDNRYLAITQSMETTLYELK